MVPNNLQEFNDICSEILGSEFDPEMSMVSYYRGVASYEFQIPQGGGTLFVTYDEQGWSYGDLTGSQGNGASVREAQADCEAKYMA